MGEAVGIIAAQSIGEPGTQLTMRTFHTGGVAGLDITSGLPRVEELFEARVPKGSAVLSDIDGIVEIQDDPEGRRIRIVSKEEYREEYVLPRGAEVLVADGEEVEAGARLAVSSSKSKSKTTAKDKVKEIVANVGGRVELQKKNLSVIWADVEEREHLVLASTVLLVKDGEHIRAGDRVTSGPLNPHDILRIKGREEVQRYMVEEVQKVYRSQGVNIHDKHIEVVARQMLRRVQVDSAGDADYIPGQTVDLFDFQNKNGKVLAEGGEPATAKPVLLGITRSSLLTDSFLAAASFQETTRVLTEAATSDAVDRLQGLKENVIIGRLIPARTHLKLPQMEAQFEMGEGMSFGEGMDGDFLGGNKMVDDLAESFSKGHDDLEDGREPLQSEAIQSVGEGHEDAGSTGVSEDLSSSDGPEQGQADNEEHAP